jgi:hypothetical protein
MPSPSPIEQARRFWKKHVDAGRYVLSPSVCPSAAVARVLRQEGLVMDVAGRRAWVLSVQGATDRRSVFLANYWPIVALVLARYEPAAVAGAGAVRLHLGDYSPPEGLLAFHSANQSEYSLQLEPGFTLRLRPHLIPKKRLLSLEAPGGAGVPTLSEADLLTTLDEREIAAGIEPVSAWLRHLVIRTPDLEQAARTHPKAAAMQRLAELSRVLKNEPLARQLDAAGRRISSRPSTPSRTGIGTRIQIPEPLARATRASGSPWLDEQAMRLARQESDIQRTLGARARTLPKFPAQLLQANAEQTRAYDAYHSTTMEGYRISRETSDAIVRGEPLPEGPQDAETLKAAMAIQGYVLAFNEVLARARKHTRIDTDLILDLFETLFRPSVDAGIIDPAALRGWRTSSVSLRGWRYIPPNPKKIPDLIQGLERFAARDDLTSLARALLLHLEFVTIHPFLDGNGRLGRLLMNYALISAGHPWVTVPSDERIPFFRSIERAQVEADAVPFTRFVWNLIKQSAKDLEASQKRPLPRRSQSTPR